jgi:signal peptidase I
MTEKNRSRQAPPPKRQQKTEELSAGATAWEWLKSGLIGFLIFIVVRTFLLQTFTIVSGSMEGTLLVGDFLVLNKSAYGASVPGTTANLPGYDTPQRNDIIVFRGHHEPIDLVKRLVGMPGDTLEMHDGMLYVNGLPQDEAHALRSGSADIYSPAMFWQCDHAPRAAPRDACRPTRDNWGPVIVPPQSFFMLGDNREDSEDSRYWGFVQRAAVKGTPLFIYYSYDPASLRSAPWLTAIRWGRIGDRVH